MHFHTGAAACLLLASVVASPLPSPANGRWSFPWLSRNRQIDYPPEVIYPPRTGNAAADSQTIYNYILSTRSVNGMPNNGIWEEYAFNVAKDETGVNPERQDHGDHALGNAQGVKEAEKFSAEGDEIYKARAKAEADAKAAKGGDGTPPRGGGGGGGGAAAGQGLGKPRTNPKRPSPKNTPMKISLDVPGAWNKAKQMFRTLQNYRPLESTGMTRSRRGPSFKDILKFRPSRLSPGARMPPIVV
ncbi:MAG: hypothetical protein M1823_005552 [Watsoniomyces obsoletus]|nr:MAG: hypothetical protein M1823_005552 [Watsoniomyces obsoletus]